MSMHMSARPQPCERLSAGVRAVRDRALDLSCRQRITHGCCQHCEHEQLEPWRQGLHDRQCAACWPRGISWASIEQGPTWPRN